MTDLFDVASTFGVPVAILAALLAGAAYLAKRLVGESGILTYVAEKHVVFLDKCDDKLERLTRSMEQTHKIGEECSEKLDLLVAAHKDSNSKISTVRLHRAGLRAVDALEIVAKKLGVEEILPTLQSIRSELERK